MVVHWLVRLYFVHVIPVWIFIRKKRNRRREPRSSGNGRRLVFNKLWVQILAHLGAPGYPIGLCTQLWTSVHCPGLWVRTSVTTNPLSDPSTTSMLFRDLFDLKLSFVCQLFNPQWVVFGTNYFLMKRCKIWSTFVVQNLDEDYLVPLIE